MPMKDFSYVNANLLNWVFRSVALSWFEMNRSWCEKILNSFEKLWMIATKQTQNAEFKTFLKKKKLATKDPLIKKSHISSSFCVSNVCRKLKKTVQRFVIYSFFFFPRCCYENFRSTEIRQRRTNCLFMFSQMGKHLSKRHFERPLCKRPTRQL